MQLSPMPGMTVAMQVPAFAPDVTQAVPLPQATHAAPERPQPCCVWAVRGMQAVAAQQPVAQGLQVPGPQALHVPPPPVPPAPPPAPPLPQTRLALHVMPAAVQSAHARPPVPHDVFDWLAGVVRHAPFESQQPTQLVESHELFELHDSAAMQSTKAAAAMTTRTNMARRSRRPRPWSLCTSARRREAKSFAPS
jgi:hypothetical protein